MNMGMQKCNRQFKIQHNQQNTNVMTRREKKRTLSTSRAEFPDSVHFFHSLCHTAPLNSLDKRLCHIMLLSSESSPFTLLF